MNFEYQISQKSLRLPEKRRQKVVHIDAWIENHAKRLERSKDHKGALIYWNRLLSRCVGRRHHERADVTKLAAIHYRMGLSHRALKDHRKSFHHLKYCVRLNSQEARYFDAFGRASLAGGHWAVACEQYQRALRLEPMNALYMRRQSWIYLMMDKKDAALRMVERAIALKPQCREARFLKAKILMETNEFLKAMETLKTMRSDPRAKKAMAFCRERMPLSLSGATLSIAKRGMTCEARPFCLRDLRDMEKLWLIYCGEVNDQILSLHLPSSWAAAVAWFVLMRRGGDQNIELADLAPRFGAGADDIWPCLLRIQRVFHDYGSRH